MNVRTLMNVDHNNQCFPENTILDIEEHEAQALILVGAAQELEPDSEEVGIKVPPSPPYKPAPLTTAEETRIDELRVIRSREAWARGAN